LPRPKHELSVSDLSVTVPGSEQIIVSNVSFSLTAGMGLALIGASASGKSSLSRALVGVWPPARGVVRLDGAALDQWHIDDLGRHIGYLPQDVALFDGTVADNIARFDPTATSDAVLDAAQVAGAHEMILRLPNGYGTRIGEGGMALSAGQRQRVGLARAVFGNPFLVVLDEPNANLDTEGEIALSKAIEILRGGNSIVIVISHRPSALSALDMAMLLHRGRVITFGQREEVFANLTRVNSKLKAPVAANNVKGMPPPRAVTGTRR
jgi:ATP-binding cassette, subfamily C, bacterial PrsD